MATTFKNIVVNNIGQTETPLLTAASNAKLTVIGLSLANLTDGVITANIKVNDGVNAGFYVKNLIIPPNSSARVVNGGEKLILAGSNILTVQANTIDSIDAIVSYVEII